MAKKKDAGEEEQGLPPFAVKLKALREAAGLTQAQLAERTGLHLGAIFKLEQGRREPAWETVQVIARALGTNCLAFASDDTLDAAPPVSPSKGEKAPGKPATGRTAEGEGEASGKGKKGGKRKGG